MASPGPVLECGSGLSTILMGFVGASAGSGIWSLENDASWLTRAEKVLQRYRLEHVRVLMAPLKDYGVYTWYGPPLEELPGDFRLVVCDGPVESTPGDRFADGAVLLLDDANTVVGSAVLARWQKAGWVRAEGGESNAGDFAITTLLRCP